MSETPNTALRDAELAEEIRALRELASVEPQRYGAFRHHTAHVLARTLARLEQIAAPPSPGDVTGPAAAVVHPNAEYTVSVLLDGDQWCAIMGDDLAVDPVGFGPTRGEALAELALRIAELDNTSLGHHAACTRGDVTGTPALRDALWQATYALDRAYLHAHAFPRGCIQGCPHRACVDDPCECGYEAGLAKIYAAVRAGQRVLMAAALSEIDTQGSRPDLTGETPPVAEQGQ